MSDTQSHPMRSPMGPKGDAIGMIANGSAGSWDVAIDETVAGVERWFVQIEGAAVGLYFHLPHPRMVEEILQFLQPPPIVPGDAARNGELMIGDFNGSTITLIRDDESDDRYFVLIAGGSESRLRFSIGGSNLQELIDALRQVRDDLDSEGLLSLP